MRGVARDLRGRPGVGAAAVALLLVAALGGGCASTGATGGADPAAGTAAAEEPRVKVPERPIRDAPPADRGEEPSRPEAGESPAAGTGEPGAAEPKREIPAGVPPPDTVAGRTFGEWLAVYNGGVEAEIERFLGQRFAPEFLTDLPVTALVAFHLQSREETGGLVPLEIKPAGEHAVQALAGGVLGDSRIVSLTVEPDPPHRITQLRLVPPGS